MENDGCRERYHAYIRELNERFLAPAVLDPYFNALASSARPFLLRDRTMFFNLPYEVPVAPATEYGTVNALLDNLHQIHANLTAQLNGETDVFYASPVYRTLPNQANDPGRILGFLEENSPSLDPGITEKICAAYPAWCRENGRLCLDAGDPAEIAGAAVFFGAVFLCLICRGRFRRRPGKKKPNKKEMDM